MKKNIILISYLLCSLYMFSQDISLEERVQHGETDAMYKLANFYLEGEGGYPQDSLKAYSYMDMAANKGNVFAMYDIGFFFRYYSQLQDSRAISTKWLETFVKKCSDDLMCSMVELELYYRYQGNDGFQRNVPLALKYLFSSVNRGNASSPEAYNVLGECYLTGKDIEKNTEEAINILNCLQTEAVVWVLRTLVFSIMKKEILVWPISI